MEDNEPTQETLEEARDRIVRKIFNDGYVRGYNDSSCFLVFDDEIPDVKFIITRLGWLGSVRKTEDDKFEAYFNDISFNSIAKESNFGSVTTDSEEEAVKAVIEGHFAAFHKYLEKNTVLSQKIDI